MYGHFIPLAHPYTTQVVAEEFMRNVFKLYGCPRYVVSDGDPIFLRNFWKAIFNAQGFSLDFNLAYHSQANG